MHELSVMQALGERVLEVAAEQGAERVLAIRLRIGSLAGVDPDALRFAAGVVLAGTPAEAATLAIEEIPAAYWCDPCGEEFGAPLGSCECPRCATLSGRLLRGRELALAAMEVFP
jgi:hydrogenase nickel incorporation protein HypA/HybF